MADVVIYSKTHCPYCVKAKRFFDQRNIKYTEHLMDDRLDELDELKRKTGHLTVPQIFINGEFIGGYTDLEAADREGKIAKLLGTA